MFSKNTKEFFLKAGIALTMSAAVSTTPSYIETMVVEATTMTAQTTVGLNLRTGASTAHRILLTIPQGATVTVVNQGSQWSEVTYGSTRGFASNAYLRVQPGTGETVPGGSHIDHVARMKTTAALNLRTGASTSHGVILTIPLGQEVTVLSSANGWSKVRYGTREGFVSNRYLAEVPLSTPKPVLPPVTTPPAADTVLGTRRTTANLNLRTSATTSSSILTTIPRNGQVEVLSESGQWSRVRYNGRTGFVHNGYLTPLSPVNPPVSVPPTVPTPPADTVLGTRRTTANLNFRTGPSTGSSIIVTIPRNASVEIFSESGQWSKVRYNGRTGYVHNGYLTVLVPVTPPEPVVPPVEEVPPVVAKKPQILLLEDLKNSYQGKTITITGRALAHDGITSVKAFVNGSEVPVVRGPRQELENLYKDGYVLENIGFTITLDAKNLSAGTHNLVVQAVGKDGTTKEVKGSFVLEKAEPILSIQGITSGTVLTASEVSITGKALHMDGVARVQYYINGVLKGTATYGLPSSVNEAEKAYEDAATGGYSFKLLRSDLRPNTMNSVKVELVGKDGTLYSNTVVLPGAEAVNFTGEVYPETRDHYARLESKRSVLPKVNNRVATLDEIAFYLDPGNFIHDAVNQYMFLELSYTKGDYAITGEELNNILTGMGVLEGMGDAFLRAAETHGVNPFYLISHAILETGRGTSVLSRGQVVADTYTRFGDASTVVKEAIPEADRKMVYNVYGIGAWDVNANYWGAHRAHDEKWFSVEEAIVGGANWISKNYINRFSKQNTLYKMRFNMAENMEHEYATDLGWAQKQAARIKGQIDAYVENNEGKTVDLKFRYPIFKNQ